MTGAASPALAGVLRVVLVVFLAVLVTGIVLDLVLRLRAIARERRYRRFGPMAEDQIANFLIGGAPPERPDSAGGREVLFSVAAQALEDLAGVERANLARMLDELGYVADARARLRSRWRGVRRRAAETLELIATPDAITALSAGLDDADVLVRCMCARALAESGGPSGAAAAVEAARSEVSVAPGQVGAIVLGLGMNQPEALAPLLRADAPADVRQIAAEVAGALRLLGHEMLVRGCLDGTDDVAAAAARSLGEIGDTRAVASLEALAADERRPAMVRSAAARALGSIGDDAAVTTLRELLRSQDWSVRESAVGALAELGGLGVDALREAAGAAAEPARAQAAAAIPR